jgi:hypothetical protein
MLGAIALGTSLCACGPTAGDGTANATDPMTTGATVMSDSTTSDSTTGWETGGDPITSSTDSDEPGDGAGGFYAVPPDGGGGALQCDLAAQDCPVGEKCVPVAADWEEPHVWLEWDAARCRIIPPAPAGLGEPCETEYSLAGFDTCDVGLWCLGEHEGMGRCAALCTSDDGCAVAGTQCIVQEGGVAGACLVPCAPLDPACEPGEGCYYFPTANRFACAPDGSGESGEPGSHCISVTECDPGAVCVDASRVPGCQHARCCTTLCDPDAGETCPFPGQTCTPLSETLPAGACTIR